MNWVIRSLPSELGRLEYEVKQSVNYFPSIHLLIPTMILPGGGFEKSFIARSMGLLEDRCHLTEIYFLEILHVVEYRKFIEIILR